MRTHTSEPKGMCFRLVKSLLICEWFLQCDAATKFKKFDDFMAVASKVSSSQLSFNQVISSPACPRSTTECKYRKKLDEWELLSAGLCHGVVWLNYAKLIALGERERERPCRLVVICYAVVLLGGSRIGMCNLSRFLTLLTIR